MNIEECISLLPKSEKGTIRDIFTPLSTYPEPYSLDLVQEYSHFSTQIIQQDTKEPHTLNRPGSRNGSGSTSKQSSKQQQLQSQQPPQLHKNNNNSANADGRFNCIVCKKSFGSESTWNSHQKSAKHISAVKDAEKKAKGGSGRAGGGGVGGGRNRQTASEEEQQPSEVVEALMSFRKVEKAVKENPGMAASVLWKIAKVLWSHRQTQDTAKVVVLLINVLTGLQATGPTALSTPAALSPTQISMTLYLSRLSLARLVVYHSQSLACQYYLDAVQGRWQIEFQPICEMVNTGSVKQLLDLCHQYLSTHSKTEKLMNPPPPPAPTATDPTSAVAPKKPADPNLKLVTILLESGTMLAQAASFQTEQNLYRAHGEIAVTLLALAMTLLKVSPIGLPDVQQKQAADVLRMMARVYKECLGMAFAASECYLLAFAEMVAEVNQHQQQLHYRELVLWDLFRALMLAMEDGDFVRMQRAMEKIEEQCPSRGGGHEEYQDVQTVIQIAQAVISQDNDFLYNQAKPLTDHLILLVQEGSGKGLLLFKRASDPLRAKESSVASLERIQSLVAV